MTTIPVEKKEVRTTFSHNNTPIFIHEQRWYFRLKKNTDEEDDEDDEGQSTTDAKTVLPASSLGSVRRTTRRARSLMDEYRIEQLEGKLIVQMVTPTNIRLYSLFDSYIEFARYSLKMAPEKRSFYEVVLADFPQKPRFDIDIDGKEFPGLAPEVTGKNPLTLSDGTILFTLDQLGDFLKDIVIENTMAILEEKGVRINLSKDVLIFTSHGPHKRSYHIVINNYCHYYHKEARALYDLVMARIPEPLRGVARAPYIDPAVYSSKQQFRIVGSLKIGSNRPKKFSPIWTYKNQIIEHVYVEEPQDDNHAFMLQLEASILTHTSSCDLIPSLLDPNAEGFMSKARYDTEDISMDLAKKALQLIAATGGTTVDDHKFPYVIDCIKGAIVCLKRTKASKCRICCRVHEHENPFLVVGGEGADKCVYFYCRRSPANKKLYLGKLEDLELPPSIATTASTWLYSDSIVEKVAELAKIPLFKPENKGKASLPTEQEQKKSNDKLIKEGEFSSLQSTWGIHKPNTR